MTQFWKNTEKVIVIFLIIWGGGLLTIEIYTFYQTIQLIHISLYDVSFKKFLNNYQLDFLLPSLILFSGIMLLLRKNLGWIFSVSVSLFTPFNYLSYLYFNSDVENTVYYIHFCIAILFLIIFILLISKPIKSKYFFNSFAWLYVAIICIFLITDSFVFHEDYQKNKKYRITEKKLLDEMDSLSKPTYSFDTIK